MKRIHSARPTIRMLAVAFLTALSLSSATTRSPAPAVPSESHIVIFHINDVHGKIDNFAKVAAILDAERKTGAQVFFFSAGDNFTGDPVVDQYDPPGEPMLEMLARLNLDVTALGNHEFDYGLEAVRRLAARFPIISANIQAPPGTLPGLKPWIALKAKDGTKLVVFSLIQIEPGNGLPSTHPDKLGDLRFSEPLSKALELKKLRAEGQVLIGLTHIGHEQDLILAGAMPEIDVIIGGHSHTRVDPAKIVNGVLVTQAGSDNLFLGRIDLFLKNGRVVEKTGRLVDLSQVKDEDPAVKAMLAKYHTNPALARVLIEAPFELTGKNALGCLFTDAMRAAHNLDIAFQNNGGIRINRLPKSITLKDVYTLDPFGNETVEIAMTAAEIRGLVKASFEKRKEIDLQVSGMTYLVRADAAKQVKSVQLNNLDGSPLAEDKTFKVGLSSYVATTYDFAHKDPGRSTRTLTVDDLIQYLKSAVDLGIYRDARRAFSEIESEPYRN